MELTAIPARPAARSATDLLNEIRQPVLVGLSKTLRRSLAGTIDDLLERLLKETGSWERRQAIDDALDLLRNGREGIELRFDRACAESWAERTGSRTAPAPARNSAPAGPGNARGAATLSLVDDAAMGDQLAVGRIAGRSRRRMDEEQVDGLRARFGALLGREWFADNEHPVAPDLVFESLRKALAEFGQARVVQFLLEAFEPRISADLSSLYADLNQRLVRMGVLPEIRYQVSKSAARQGGVQQAPAAGEQPLGQQSLPAGAAGPANAMAMTSAPVPGGATPGAGAGADGGQAGFIPAEDDCMRLAPMRPAAVDELIRDLGERVQAAQGTAVRYLGDANRFAGPASEAPVPSERLLAALTTLQAAPIGGQDVSAQVVTAKAVSSAVAREHGSPLERLIIETVSLVFEHVYEDEAISDAIKQQLLRLQVAAFKAALIDPSFFARPEHPMRRFIDCIAAVGSDADFENEAGSPLVADVAELVSWVLATFERDLGTLEEALGRIDAIVAAEVARREARLARIAAAAQKSEELERARARVREELSSGFGPETPEFACRFVCEPWAEVVSRIATGAEFAPFDVQRARRTVDLLLWSVTPKLPSEIPALAAELPQLIADLSRGLSFVALSAAERELFFSELLAWHGATIDDAKRGRPATAQAASAAATGTATTPARPTASAPGLAGAGSQAAPRSVPHPAPRLMSTAAASPAARPAAPPAIPAIPAIPLPGPAADSSPVPVDDDVARLGLTNGSEVEIAGPNGDVKRFKVGWMSPTRSVFIFSRYPRDHWTARRPILNGLLAQGRIRLVSRGSQTGEAIETLKSR